MSINNDLKNKSVIVTGGANGIGRACVEKFLSLGMYVFSFDFNEEDNKKMSDEINSKKLFIYTVDVTDPLMLNNAVLYVLNKAGRIDCVVNNAGIHPKAMSIEDYPTEDFNKLINMNLTSAFMLTKYVYPFLKITKGTIINISSMVATLGQAKAVAYCASKAGLIGMTKALAIDSAEYGIRVNCVSPSNVKTKTMTEWLNSTSNPTEMEKAMADVQQLKRMASPLEIAEVVAFLASDQSSFITGQNIKVDGGASLDY